MELKTYLKQLDGELERVEFARLCGTSIGYLRNIAYCGRPCGERLAIELEKNSSGAIRCEDLRPDVDWAYLRGTSPDSGRKAA